MQKFNGTKYLFLPTTRMISHHLSGFLASGKDIKLSLYLLKHRTPFSKGIKVIEVRDLPYKIVLLFLSKSEKS